MNLSGSITFTSGLVKSYNESDAARAAHKRASEELAKIREAEERERREKLLEAEKMRHECSKQNGLRIQETQEKLIQGLSKIQRGYVDEAIIMNQSVVKNYFAPICRHTVDFQWNMKYVYGNCIDCAPVFGLGGVFVPEEAAQCSTPIYKKVA